MRNRRVLISPETTSDLANPAGDLAPRFADIDSWRGALSAAGRPGDPSANPANANANAHAKSSDRIRTASLPSIDTPLPDARQEYTPTVHSVARRALFRRRTDH